MAEHGGWADKSLGDNCWAEMIVHSDENVDWCILGGGTMAHELGHTHGLDHAGCTTEEHDFAVDEDFPWSHSCNLADARGDTYYGLDVYYAKYDQSEPSVIPPTAARPYMSYLRPAWADAYFYCVLLNEFGVDCDLFGVDASALRGERPEAAPDPARLAALHAAPLLITVQGLVDEETGTGEEACLSEGALSLGPHRLTLTATDSDGQSAQATVEAQVGGAVVGEHVLYLPALER